ncbi:MAG TPA: DUF433 domain-containing protein [Tepidisphaeraceae bacterium]|jgi:uncharacterized protein (DUF433 family)
MTVATIPHVVIDEKGIARVAGSRIRVIDLAMERTGWGMSPEQIHESHPHLTLAQIYAALAYYFDHKAELDAKIEAGRQFAEELRREAGEPDLVKRLRAQGKLP